MKNNPRWSQSAVFNVFGSVNVQHVCRRNVRSVTYLHKYIPQVQVPCLVTSPLPFPSRFRLSQLELWSYFVRSTDSADIPKTLSTRRTWLLALGRVASRPKRGGSGEPGLCGRVGRVGAAERVGEVWMDGIGRLERMVACWRAGFRMFSLEFRGAWDDVPELGYIYIYIYLYLPLAWG